MIGNILLGINILFCIALCYLTWPRKNFLNKFMRPDINKIHQLNVIMRYMPLSTHLQSFANSKWKGKVDIARVRHSVLIVEDDHGVIAFRTHSPLGNISYQKIHLMLHLCDRSIDKEVLNEHHS